MTPTGASRSPFAAALQGLLLRCDPRLLVPMVMAWGLGAWLLPWPILVLSVPLACALLFTALALFPTRRGILRLYAGFALFWGISYFLLQLWSRPGDGWHHVWAALIFSGRLFSLLGLALAIPLALSSMVLGRVLTWYIGRLVPLERTLRTLPLLRKREPILETIAWKSGLALAVMTAFLPRAFLVLGELNRNLRLRAPRLRLHRRLMLLCLAALRILGAQTWDMSVSIASRGLYRPGPWQWRRD